MNNGVKDENLLGCYIVSIGKLPTSRSFVVLKFRVFLGVRQPLQENAGILP